MVKKPIIGILGAPGSGKTTVSNAFEKLKCKVINADQLNHQMLAKPSVIEQLTQWWGDNVLTDQGQIDHQVVGQIVFNDKTQLDKLTNLVHPLIKIKQDQLIQQYQNDPNVKAIVLDIPLLLETGQKEACDTLVFVQVDPAIRYERLKKTRGWDDEKIKNVENLQFALDIKAEISEYIISNNSGIPETTSQVDDILSLILEKYNC